MSLHYTDTDRSFTITVSQGFQQWALSYLGNNYQQVGNLPVWLNNNYVVKLFFKCD